MAIADYSYVGTMLQAVRRTYPEEACGLLVGCGDAILEAVPLVNHAGDRRREYRIAADDLLAVHRRAVARGCDVIGVFHSHPDGEAELSATDIAQGQPGWTYVVIGTCGREPSGIAMRKL